MCLDDELPDESTPIGRTTREFFDNNWERARTGLLSQTTKLRVAPQPSPAPRVFHFELDCTFKRKTSPDALVELARGPLRGTIRYRADIYTAPPDVHSLTVFVQHFGRTPMSSWLVR